MWTDHRGRPIGPDRPPPTKLRNVDPSLCRGSAFMRDKNANLGTNDTVEKSMVTILDRADALMEQASTKRRALRAPASAPSRFGRTCQNDIPADKVKQQEHCLHEWTQVGSGLCLSSSDQVKFWVPEHHLLAHSPIFRDVFLFDGALNKAEPSSNPDEKKTIKFTDALCETAEVVRLFLFAITGRFDQSIVDQYYPLTNVRASNGTLTFAKKYDIPLVLQLIEGYLNLAAERGHDHPQLTPIDIFILAAKANMVQPAKRVIANYTPIRTRSVPNEVGWHFEFLDCKFSFELNSFTKKMWDEIPKAYLYALLTAGSKSVQAKPKAEAFERLLEKN